MLSVPPQETKQMSKEGKTNGKLKREKRFWMIPMSPERVPCFYPEYPFQNKILQLLWTSLWEQLAFSPVCCSVSLQEGGSVLGHWGCSPRHLLWLRVSSSNTGTVSFCLLLGSSTQPRGSLCTALQATLLAVKQTRELFG